jgi:hypothetical protein
MSRAPYYVATTATRPTQDFVGALLRTRLLSPRIPQDYHSILVILPTPATAMGD